MSSTFLECCQLYCCTDKVILPFESVDEIGKSDTQMRAIELHFLVVLFILLYKVILTFESVDEIRKRDHSNKSH